MLIPNKHNGYSKDGRRTYHLDMGGGGGGGGAANQTVTQENAISKFAAPYVENMLGKAEALTSQPYQKYPGQRTADFTDMQNQAFGSAQNLGVMGQTQAGSQLAGAAGLGALNMQYDPMMARTQNFGGRQAAQYMSPFLQESLAPQLREAARNSAIQGQQNAAQAVGQGAFGGSRAALVEAERQRNLGMQQGDILSKGYQDAYTNATQQFNADQARQLQTQQANIGQQQFGANLGLQGLQTGLTAANTLGQLGQNQYAQETGNISLQNQLGTQQQQQQQNVMNQQYQDFLTQKQNPYTQLSFMQNMLAGTPLASSTQQVYSNPSMLSQVAGLGTAAAGAYGLAKAKGGKIKEQKRPAGLAELALSKMG
jgi:hypothetical protein